MSESSKLSRLELAGAERRVRHDLDLPVGSNRSIGRRTAVVALASLLFAAIFAMRLVIDDPGALVANFYAVPIALLAAEMGLRAGLAAAALAFALVVAWGAVKGVHVGLLGYVARAAVFLMVGALVGRYSEARERDLALRRQVNAEFLLRAGDLERSNAELRRALVRIEAFAEIARSVGGETDVGRVLQLILDHGRGVMDARELVIRLMGDESLEQGSVLAGVMRKGSPVRLAARGGRPVELAPGIEAHAAVVAPMVYRGERLGVVAALDPGSGDREFDDEDEQLMNAVATSAATALATAQSVAKERLRDSIEAAEQARARWARELHDETLQGLVGLRMGLSSARRSGSAEVMAEALAGAVDQTKREIVNLRALIAELRPAALDELGLGPAIETLASRSGEAAGIEVSTRLSLGDAERLTPDTESAIYRLVQEALTNVAKHACASRVAVLVARSNGTVSVSVEDDGRGFDPAEVHGGLGLVGMRERVELTGGKLEISSAPGRPTSVRAVLPAG